MGIHPDEFDDGIVQRELNRAEFRGPDESATLTSTGIDSSYDKFGYTFHRARFDDWLRDRAEDAGAEYRAGVSVRGVDTDPAVSPESDDPDTSSNSPPATRSARTSSYSPTAPSAR